MDHWPCYPGIYTDGSYTDRGTSVWGFCEDAELGIRCHGKAGGALSALIAYFVDFRMLLEVSILD